MVEQEPVKDVTKPKGLEDDDVWGDEADVSTLNVFNSLLY
jgi:hypothetical protein